MDDDLQRDAASRLTFDPAQDNSSPVWSPDSRRIAFTKLRDRSFGIFVKSANGTGGEQPLAEAGVASPRSWSRDGKWMFYMPAMIDSSSDVWMVPLDGRGKPTRLLGSDFQEFLPALSPDGKWLAYVSSETGRPEVYVRSFPDDDGKWQVSTAGGTEPRWRGDSKELFYLERAQLGSLMSVGVSTAGGALAASLHERYSRRTC